MTESTTGMLWMALMVLLPMIPAVVLFKYLPSTGDASGPLSGLTVKFGGAFAGYLVIFLLLWFRQGDTDHYHTWTVVGTVKVNLADGETEPNLNDVVVRFVPPRLGVMNQGIFSWEIPVIEDASGRLQFPDLQLDLRGYRGVTIPLRQDRVYGSLEQEVIHNNDDRLIVIKDPVTLHSAKSGRVYVASTAVVPLSAPPVEETAAVAVLP